MALNLQEMAASAYKIITMLNNEATQMVGLDALWCRATPEANSEDVVLQEYTLTNVGVECPKPMKILMSDSNYNPGNFTVDLFGINYDAPVEVNVTIDDWKKTFGSDSMPQQGDVVYIKMLHKLFEVKTSEIIYSIASMPTYYKCQLAKYNPTASRKETEEFRNTMDEMTVSQETLFGDKISQEVADADVEVETAYQNTTYQDALKDFDMESVTYEKLYGPDGNIISNAYYNMTIAEKPVTYRTAAFYTTDTERPHWIFTTWFRSNSDNKPQESVLRKFTLYLKNKSEWIFIISTPLKLNIGDEITIRRGSLIKITGTVIELPNEQFLGVKFKANEMIRLDRKISKWYEQGSFKIQKADKLTLIKSDNETYYIKVNPAMKTIDFKFGNITKTIKLDPNVDFSTWTYLALDNSDREYKIVIKQLGVNQKNEVIIEDIEDSTGKAIKKAGDFSFETLAIDSKATSLNIRNIRLYENEYPIGDSYKLDMLSPVTRNASKLIVVDGPMPKNEAMFFSPVH